MCTGTAVGQALPYMREDAQGPTRQWLQSSQQTPLENWKEIAKKDIHSPRIKDSPAGPSCWVGEDTSTVCVLGSR